MKIVFPMAGRGSRFQILSNQNQEYKKPKPLIEVKGKPMIVWAVESLPFIDLPNKPATTQIKVTADKLIFIILKEHENTYNISTVLKKLFGDTIQIVVLPKVTRGAVETVLCAKNLIDTNEDILIADCDNYFDGTNLYTAIVNKTNDTEGIIPVIVPPDPEPKYSYTLFDKNYTAITVGEKDPELASKGAYANIGAYYFSHGNVFVKEAEKMIQENALYGPAGKGEFYIAPIYQRMIQHGLKVTVAVIPRLWGLGTPKDLDYFLQNLSAK